MFTSSTVMLMAAVVSPSSKTRNPITGTKSTSGSAGFPSVSFFRLAMPGTVAYVTLIAPKGICYIKKRFYDYLHL